MLTALGFLAAIAFWPGLVDPATEPRWIVLAIGVPLCLMLAPRTQQRAPRWTLAWLPVAALTIAWAPDRLAAGDALVHLVILAGAFWLGASIESAAPVWRGIEAGVAVSVAAAAAQLAGWEGIAQAQAPAGLFVNRNVLADACLVALVSAAAGGRWRLAAIALAGLGLTAAKAAIGAAIIAGAFAFRRRRPRVALAAMACVACAAAAVFAFGHPSALARLSIWRPALEGLAWFGHGLGSFAAAFPIAEHAHSEPLQLAWELGLLALPIGAAFVYALGGGQRENEPERLVLVAIAAVSLLAFPLRMPLTAFAAALAAGCLAGARHRVRRNEPPLAGGYGLGV